MTRTASLICFLAAGLSACGHKRDAAPSAPAATPVAARVAPPPAPPPTSVNDYVPAEFKNGKARWKDTGVYVDGKPIAFLNWGELPITLQPTWVKDKVSQNKPPGSNIPAWRWAQQRYYKFDDYLVSLGIDPRSIREMHIYGPQETNTLIVTGRELASANGHKLMFRFGANVSGKAIPQIPPDIGNNRHPDKISAVMIYIKKAPPKLVPDDGFYLDGRPVDGVPYYGEPARGGVRVYLDNKLAAIIKRQDLDNKDAVTIDKNGDAHWSLYAFLGKHGVDTSKVAEGWAIKDEKRTDRIPGDVMKTITFTATAQAKGQVVLGDQKITAQVIALHTHVLADSELPKITPDDDDD